VNKIRTPTYSWSLELRSVLDTSGDFTCNQTAPRATVVSFWRQLYSFDLKLTNTACGGAELQTGTGQCEQGYGYDAAQQCCSPVSSDGGNSTVVRIDLGGCPLPQGAATPESTPLP
jgi:hypothetical protein